MMEINNLQQYLDRIMHEYNNQVISDFEGYSPNEMQFILHKTFEKGSPIQLQQLPEADYIKIPILNQIKYLAKLLDNLGEIKLTQKGFLPTKIVADVYQQRFLKDEFIESGISKLYKETDAESIHLTHILIEIGGLVKKQNGKISLTKKSKVILENDHELLRLIFQTFATKFNWAYFDGYGENHIGQFGYGFSLVLLSKYGNQQQLDSFYSEKYFKAFPQLLGNVKPDNLDSIERRAKNCYSIRTFDRFLHYFGLIQIEKPEKLFHSMKYITKTELFDQLIQCRK